MTGKLVGGLLGWMIWGGIIGALAGLLLGALFDSCRAGNRPAAAYHRPEHLFAHLFRLAGHLAKSDGRISETEIATVERWMEGMRLSRERRAMAISLFREGAAQGFDLISNLRGLQGLKLPERLMLFDLLSDLAMSDGLLTTSEEHLLVELGLQIGLGQAQIEGLISMRQARGTFGHGGPRGRGDGYAQGDETRSGRGSSGAGPIHRATEIDRAYQALGLKPEATEKEIKHAYRKLMSQHHPDRLIAAGVPKDMLRSGTEQCRQIRAAYDILRQHRGF